MNKQELIEVIMAELRVICEENNLNVDTLNQETMLFGGGSIIDSLSLVGLIIKVEEHILEKTGKEIQLIDENAIIADGITPFRNALTLAELALVKTNEA